MGKKIINNVASRMVSGPPSPMGEQRPQIPMHPERGLDPRETYCPQCGRPTPEIAIGHTLKAKLPGSNVLVYYPIDKIDKAYAALVDAGLVQLQEPLEWEELYEGEMIRARNPCPKCQIEAYQMQLVVDKGGIYWKCEQCNAHGVIAKCEFTEKFRASNPGSTGIAYKCANKEGNVGCPQCKENEQQ
jgi:hypothetical protein